MAGSSEKPDYKKEFVEKNRRDWISANTHSDNCRGGSGGVDNYLLLLAKESVGDSVLHVHIPCEYDETTGCCLGAIEAATKSMGVEPEKLGIKFWNRQSSMDPEFAKEIERISGRVHGYNYGLEFPEEKELRDLKHALSRQV